jgi:hypothetical protein
MYCQDIAVKPNTTNMEGDCGGSPGASGTGFVNVDNVLIAMHRGAGNSVESSNWPESMYASWSMAFSECNVSSGESLMPCFHRLRDIIESTARNPRSRMIDAYWIYELWKSHEVNP